MTSRRVILVSGGSRGLGAALVRDLLARDYTVATFSRSKAQLEELLERETERLFWQPVDLADGAGVKRFVHEVARRFGRIDGFVSNAAMVREGVFPLTTPSDVDALLAINLRAAIFAIQTCARVMLTQESGSIVAVSSVNAVRGNAGVAVYSATKAALDGLIRSLARELGPRNIRCNSVAPGYFESDMTASMADAERNKIVRRTPLGRLGQPEDLVGAICFLLSEDARFITGQTLVIDGGLSC